MKSLINPENNDPAGDLRLTIKLNNGLIIKCEKNFILEPRANESGFEYLGKIYEVSQEF